MGKKLLVLDWDTPVVSAAAMCQNTYVAKHKESGIETPVKSQKAFKAKIDKKYWDDYEFIYKPTPITPPTDKTDVKDFKPEYVGMHSVKVELEKVLAQSASWRKDYWIVVHKEGNHRNEIATIAEYKGNRKPKPIFTQTIKEYVVDKYKDKVIYVEGEETDDRVVQFMHQEFLRVGEDKPNFDVVLGGIDKDLRQVVGWHWNFRTFEFEWIDSFKAAKNFFIQTIMGDGTDNIKGLVDLPTEVKKQYGATARKGVGIKTAELLLADCKKPQEMFQRVVDLYKIQYPDNWFPVLEENCQLLYLKKTPDDSYNLQERLERFKINV